MFRNVERESSRVTVRKKVSAAEKLKASKRQLRMESICDYDGSGAAHPTPEELQVAWVMQQRANDILDNLSDSSDLSTDNDHLSISSADDNNDK